MRIGIAGFSIEACSFSPKDTRYDDFSLIEGEELLDRIPEFDTFTECQFIPLIKARSIPGGAVDKAAYARLKHEIISRIEDAVPLDGLYLDMHGAGYARDMEDLEGDLYMAIRRTVGDDCFIAASYDLHGNISTAVFRSLDFISAYRTAPHVDAEQTRRRTVKAMVRCMAGGERPVKAWVSLPMILPGEVTSTDWNPGKRLYERLPLAAGRSGVIDASVLMGYPWVDEPRAGASVLVFGTDSQSVKSEAQALASELWDARGEFDFGVPAFSADECVERAIAEREGPVFISDSGDNPTAGGAGDTTGVLGSLIERRARGVVFTSIPDPVAVQAAVAAGCGEVVSLSLGGKLDTVHSQPIDVTGTVERIVHTRDAAGRPNTLVLYRCDGILVIIAEQRTPFLTRGQFDELGIDLSAAKIVVVKLGYLVPDFAEIAQSAYLALSEGAVDQRLSKRPYESIRRPIYPLDTGIEFNADPIVIETDAR